MNPITTPMFWLLSATITTIALYYLSPILTPFLLSALLAYLINPIIKRMEKTCRIPHILSVVIVFITVITITVVCLFTLYPYALSQIESFINVLPQVYEWVMQVGIPWLLQYVNINTIKSNLPSTLSKSGWVLSTFLESSAFALQSLVNIALIPVVTFYLLRDWDTLLNNVKSMLPRDARPTILQLARDCDDVLSAFIRGQLLVMCCLAIIYSLGLSIIGLKFSLIIGMLGGLLSIVPYLGSGFVLITSLITAFMQAGFDHMMLYALLVFIIGQGIEGYILTPYLVGDKIGLHPVAVIFAVMTGGTLFGFFGILLALPVAAVIMATIRFFVSNKLHSA